MERVLNFINYKNIKIGICYYPHKARTQPEASPKTKTKKTVKSTGTNHTHGTADQNVFLSHFLDLDPQVASKASSTAGIRSIRHSLVCFIIKQGHCMHLLKDIKKAAALLGQ